MTEMSSQDRATQHGLCWAREKFGDDFVNQYEGVLMCAINGARSQHADVVPALQEKIRSLIKRQGRMVVKKMAGQPPVLWEPSGGLVNRKWHHSDDRDG